MKLRCVSGKQGDVYWAECLKLGLRAEANEPILCRQRVDDAIDAHLKTLFESQDKPVAIRPVRGYWYRKLLWELQIRMHNGKPPVAKPGGLLPEFSLKRQVPESVGVGMG